MAKFLIVGLGNIGDEYVGCVPYRLIVETAREYIRAVGGFEAFAEWGLY